MKLQQIKNIDIVDTINHYYSLERYGSLYKMLCPFHNDKKTPSFTVTPSKNLFNCFGCDAGGSVIDFIMSQENLQFSKACNFLVENFAGNIKRKIINVQSTSKIKLTQIKDTTINYWHNYLLQSERINYFIQRGLNTITILREMFGWDGKYYTIPIWSERPSASRCIGTRFRKSELCEENVPKYTGVKGLNRPGFWGRWYTRSKDYMIMFAGELDAALAVQDGLPACSLVNGMNSFARLPRNWPITMFPNVKNLLVLFDKGEELAASKVLTHWNKIKGDRLGDVIHWILPSNSAGDYIEFRKEFIKTDIKKMIQLQTGVALI
jgi:hypothetical protein